MLLMYYLNEEGKRRYTFKTTDPNGNPTISAHPARFTPEDKFSEYRIMTKERFGILPTQRPPIVL